MALSIIYEKCCCGAVLECRTSTEASAERMLYGFRVEHRACREQCEADSVPPEGEGE